MSKLRAYGLALACLLVVILAPDLARAAEAVPALAPTLSLPWGQWLIDVLNVASASCVPILVGYLGYLARQYVPALGQVLTNALIDRAVRLAADFALQAIEGPWTVEAVEEALGGVLEREGVKPGKLYQPLRVALAGTTVSPGIFETVTVLGREETLARLNGGMSGLNRPSTGADRG